MDQWRTGAPETPTPWRRIVERLLGTPRSVILERRIADALRMRGALRAPYVMDREGGPFRRNPAAPFNLRRAIHEWEPGDAQYTDDRNTLLGIDWDDLQPTVDRIVDWLIPYARQHAASLEIGRFEHREVRRADGSVKRIPLGERPPYAWKAHPGIIGVARALGITDMHLGAWPASSHEDSTKSIAETTPWPQRTYWRIERKRVGQFGVNHVIGSGRSDVHKVPGTVAISTGRHGQGMVVEIMTPGKLPETVQAAYAGLGLADILDGFALPEGAIGGDRIVDMEDVSRGKWRNDLPTYHIHIEDAPYIPIAPCPDNMDMRWMDDGWGRRP